MRQPKKCREVANACGLLHVVCDRHDGTELLQLHQQLFDFRRADGIERGAGLVQQQDLRFDGKRAGDAQALLLAAGKFISGFLQMVLHFIPESGMPQAFFDGLGDGELGAVDPKAVGNVVENGLGEGVRTLKNHADAAAIGGDVLGQDILAVEKNLAFEPCAPHRLVHAVKGTQERRFATARRTDERGDFVRGDSQVDIEEGLLVAIKKIDLGDGHAHGEARGRLAGRSVGHDRR